MGASFGIIGLAKSGKTAIFNALTGGKAAMDSTAPHIGVVRLPEPRLKVLAALLQPQKVVPAEATYIDVGASVKGPARGRTAGGQMLAQVSNADALVNVVRAFTDESVPHDEGSVDVERDIATANLELVLSDLTIIEKRQGRIEASLKGAKQLERQSLLREQELLSKLRAELERDIPVRETGLTAEDVRVLAGYQFLTAKPLLIVVNIGEEQLPQAASLEAELVSRYSRPNCRLIALCGKLEMELAQLGEGAAEAFRVEFGMKESGLDRTFKLSGELLGLFTFFTIASGEVRAWSIPRGTTAVKAAGKIHSDMERGFIRAEVVSYDDLVKCGSLAEARKSGLLRLEGKSYIVQDGDIITFLFSV